MAATYSTPKQSSTPRLANLRKWFLPLSLISGLLLWQVVVMIAGLPAFILPSSLDVARRFIEMVVD
ncbi:MAG: hypothetical protein WCG34_05090, partial [Leptolinea sp.]